MNVRDVMSTRLIAVRPDEPLKELARALVRNRIGGVPVTDPEGRVLGIVSESDLQPTKEEAPIRPIRTAADVMTRPVITLTEDDTVTQAARVLQRHRIKRAPVLRRGVLVGMITRSDLLRPYLRTDSEIRADVEQVLLGDGLGLTRDRLQVRVESGVVRLQGLVPDRRHQAVTVRLARGVEGVIDVVDDLRVA
ncbi:MAG: CBS domain-containing protein [Actinomycetota bacterium]